MINISINNPNIENILQQTYGTNYNRLIEEFSQFIQTTKIKEDIGISIQQLKQGEGIKLTNAFNQIKQNYE
ncbi:MAG: hypothetical protein KAU26_10205 [Methylococcales bacterium]|nr:hypothetical protein [Methylococcales bacterium]